MAGKKKDDPVSVNQTASGELVTQVAGDQKIVNIEQKISRLPSVLIVIVPALQSVIGSEIDPSLQALSFDISQKIEFNSISRFRCVISYYGQYGSIIDGIYDTYDSEVPGARNRIFNFLKAVYLSVKAETLKSATGTEIEVVKANSDVIFELVVERVRRDLNLTDVNAEDLEFASQVLASHAFVNCKILERPE